MKVLRLTMFSYQNNNSYEQTNQTTLHVSIRLMRSWKGLSQIFLNPTEHVSCPWIRFFVQKMLEVIWKQNLCLTQQFLFCSCAIYCFTGIVCFWPCCVYIVSCHWCGYYTISTATCLSACLSMGRKQRSWICCWRINLLFQCGRSSWIQILRQFHEALIPYEPSFERSQVTKSL